MNLVFCAYAYKNNFQSGHNMTSNDTVNVYLKNCFVALKSCRYFNPDIEVALITNMKLNVEWTNLYQNNNIKIFNISYQNFLFSPEYDWSLAFYKLCALKYATTLDYNNIALIDTDTYTQRTFDDIWNECKTNILLYDISRGLYNGDYKIFYEEAQNYLNTKEYLTRWGGEFIAGNRFQLKAFIDKCEEIYFNMLKNNFITISGDEFIISIAAWYFRKEIKNAAAYVFRYWTAYRWHYVCSNYESNAVCVLHGPREKNYGLIKIFNYINRKGKLPSTKKVYRILNLDLYSYLKIELIRKLINFK